MKIKKKIILMFAIFFIALILFIFVICAKNERKQSYNKAIDLYNEKQYVEAADIFYTLGLYEDSFSYLLNSRKYIKYNEASKLYKNNEFKSAWEKYLELGNFEDSIEMARKSSYAYANEQYEKGNLEEAFSIFQNLGDYMDSSLRVATITLELKSTMEERIYILATQYYESKEYKLALDEFKKIEDYKNSAELKAKCEEEIWIRQCASKISAGTGYSTAITQSGTVITTKERNLNWSDIVSISCKGVFTVGLQPDRRVVIDKRVSTEVDLDIDTTSWENIIDIATGEMYVIGLKSDGTVESAGHNGDGQRNVGDWKDIIAVDAGWRHTVGLTSEGRVKFTGHGQECSEVESWNNIISVKAGGGAQKGRGGGHTVGLKEDGTVVAAGDNSYGQCDVSGPEWTNIVAISAGDWHTVGLREDGTVVSTRPDASKYPDLYMDACNVNDWKGIVAISAGNGTTIGLKEDGTVVAVGNDDQGQTSKANEWKDIEVVERPSLSSKSKNK